MVTCPVAGKSNEYALFLFKIRSLTVRKTDIYYQIVKKNSYNSVRIP